MLLVLMGTDLDGPAWLVHVSVRWRARPPVWIQIGQLRTRSTHRGGGYREGEGMVDTCQN